MCRPAGGTSTAARCAAASSVPPSPATNTAATATDTTGRAAPSACVKVSPTLDSNTGTMVSGRTSIIDELIHLSREELEQLETDGWKLLFYSREKTITQNKFQLLIGGSS